MLHFDLRLATSPLNRSDDGPTLTEEGRVLWCFSARDGISREDMHKSLDRFCDQLEETNELQGSKS